MKVKHIDLLTSTQYIAIIVDNVMEVIDNSFWLITRNEMVGEYRAIKSMISRYYFFLNLL